MDDDVFKKAKEIKSSLSQFKEMKEMIMYHEPYLWFSKNGFPEWLLDKHKKELLDWIDAGISMFQKQFNEL